MCVDRRGGGKDEERDGPERQVSAHCSKLSLQSTRGAQGQQKAGETDKVLVPGDGHWVLSVCRTICLGMILDGRQEARRLVQARPPLRPQQTNQRTLASGTQNRQDLARRERKKKRHAIMLVLLLKLKGKESLETPVPSKVLFPPPFPNLSSTPCSLAPKASSRPTAQTSIPVRSLPIASTRLSPNAEW